MRTARTKDTMMRAARETMIRMRKIKEHVDEHDQN